MKLFNKSVRSLIVLAIVLAVSFVSLRKVPKTVHTIADNIVKQTIIIDAGHGGLTNTTH